MFTLTKLLTTLILPPASNLILCIFSLIFYRLQRTKIAAFCLLFALFSLYFFSTPFLAQKLQQAQAPTVPLSLNEYRQAEAIVLLGGGVRRSEELFSDFTLTGTPLERLRYAVYLHKQTQLPLLVTGGSPENTRPEAEVMAEELKQFWQTEARWLENHSHTTKENALFSKEILQQAGITKIILVTNQWHIPRAQFLFEQQGFTVLPAPVGGKVANLFPFLPQARALNQNAMLLKEQLGLLVEQLYAR
jgi:uncharacterized SAM-binding protein YcdF (DUF218 family)